MFGVLGPRCWTGLSILDCHVLKGFGIHMIGILGNLSDVVGGFSCTSFTHHASSSCNPLVNIKGLESTFFLLQPLTKRYIGHGVSSGVLALEPVLSRAKGATYTHL